MHKLVSFSALSSIPLCVRYLCFEPDIFLLFCHVYSFYILFYLPLSFTHILWFSSSILFFCYVYLFLFGHIHLRFPPYKYFLFLFNAIISFTSPLQIPSTLTWIPFLLPTYSTAPISRPVLPETSVNVMHVYVYLCIEHLILLESRNVVWSCSRPFVLLCFTFWYLPRALFIGCKY